MSIRTRIMISLLGTSLLAISLIGAQGFQIGFSTLERLSFDALTSIREAKRGQIEMMFDRTRAEVMVLAANPAVVKILQSPNDARDNKAHLSAIADALKWDDIHVAGPQGAHYVSAKMPSSIGLGNAPLPLIDAALKQAMELEQGRVVLQDFQPLSDKDTRPVALMLAPIFADGQMSGAVVVQLSTDVVNSVIVGDGHWETIGLGATGEAYIVGADGFMRSDTRLLSAMNEGTQAQDTAILRQAVSSASFDQVSQGETGTVTGLNYIGVMSNASYTPLNIDDVDWVLIAEMSRAEALGPVFYFAERMAISTAIVMIILMVITYGISGGIIKPFRLLIDGAREYRRGRFEVHIEGMQGREAVELGDAFNSMADGMRALLVEREKQLDLAKEASQLKSTFVANMSHELRTPLNAILGITEMVLEEAKEGGDTYLVEPLSRVTRAGEHLLGIINDILDISKIEAGKIELHPEEVDVHSILDDLEVHCKSLAQKNSNQYKQSVGPGVASIRTDTVRLRQILLNILGNAFKFTKNGVVSLDVSLAGEDHANPSLKFVIKDTGIGMNVEQLKRVFGEFTQADSTTTKKYGGTGLGMAISKKLADLMHGSITVESVVGEGTCFTVTVPMDIMHGHKSIKSHKALPHRDQSGEGGGVFVLVVDDDQSAREVIANILIHNGYEVKTASDAAEAMGLAREDACGAIVLDINMPGVSGWDVLAALKSDTASESKPVIMCSMLDEKNKGYALGAADFISKPVRKDELLDAIERHLAGALHADILLVDDSNDVRRIFHTVLVRAGHHVREATNGIEALQQMERNVPDLVIMDVGMPEMDGFELLDRMAKTKVFQSIPVIVATALDLTGEQKERLRRSVTNIIERENKDISHYAGQIARAVASITQNMK